ncbi:MAG: hypothetical protein MJZ25_04890 [Fibrobacter sp.]|nr:hypothetical protein [Fibrobacter sp.]
MGYSPYCLQERTFFRKWRFSCFFGFFYILICSKLWGLLHFLMGGLPFALIKGAQHGLCTPRQYYIAYALMFIQLILNIYDVLNISRGKYSNGTGSFLCGLLEAIANAVPA